jgi:uncharacterized protein YhaN
MKIEMISIRSFGLLRNYQESFQGGVNIIEGANETGKSTLAAFIRYMLYGFGEETGVLSEREKRINWVTGTADGSMILSAGGKRYRIERKTERSGIGAAATYRDSCEMFDADSGTPVLLQTSPGELLLGVGRELYESTAFLGQLSDSAEHADEMKESIENLLFSGNEKVNTGRAITALTEARDTLLTPDSSEGRLTEIRSRCTALTTRLADAMKNQHELIAKRQKLDEAIAKREEAGKCRDNLQELHVCYRNHQILTSFEQLHAMRQQSEDLAVEAQEYRNANSYGTFFPDENYANDLSVKRHLWADSRARFEEADEVQRELENKQIFGRDVQKNLQRAEKHGGEAQVLARYEVLHGKFRLFLLIALACIVVCAALAVSGTIHYVHADTGGALFVLWVIGCALTFLGGVVMTVLSIGRRENERAYCLDYGAKDGHELHARMKMVADCRESSAAHLQNLRDARDRTDAARTAYFSARNVLDDALGVWGKSLPTAGDATDFLDVFEGSVRDTIRTYRSIIERKTALDSAVEVLAAFLSTYREEEVRALVPEHRRAALADTTPEQIDDGIAYYDGQYRFFSDEVTELQRQTEALLATAEDPAEVSEQLSEAEGEQNRLRDRYNAMETALATLTGADIRLRAELSPRLAHYAQELMDVMTEGKYTAMTVTDDLQLQFKSDGEERSVEALSGGTREIAYIALRLALVRLLYRESPPLCFDESFAHQDNDRCYSMLKVFLTLSERNGTQSFLLTCRSREYTVAKEIGGDCNLIKMI